MAEKTMEQKAAQPQPASVPVPGARMRLVARVSMVLAAVAWGLTAAHLLSAASAMGPEVVAVRAASYRAGALGIGAALAVVLGVFGLRKLGGFLEWHKPGQARWVRGTTLGAVALLAFYGCASFYQLPDLASRWWTDLASREVFGRSFALKPILFPAAAIFFTAVTACYVLLNRPKWAEFQIEMEGELRKVSWPARKDYVGSSIVVVIVVAVVSTFLYVADLGLSEVMQRMGIGF